MNKTILFFLALVLAATTACGYNDSEQIKKRFCVLTNIIQYKISV